MGRGCGERHGSVAWAWGAHARTQQTDRHVGFPLSECFLVLVILSLSQGQNCLFSTGRNPIRENLAGNFDHHSPRFSEGPCFGYRSELKLCRVLGGRQREWLQKQGLSAHGPASSWETRVLEGTPEEELGTFSSLNSYEFKFMKCPQNSKAVKLSGHETEF